MIICLIAQHPSQQEATQSPLPRTGWHIVFSAYGHALFFGSLLAMMMHIFYYCG